MMALFFQFLPSILGIAGIMGAVAVIFFKGRSAGKAAEVRKQEKANDAFKTEVTQIDSDITHAGDADLDRRLRDNSSGVGR